MTIDDLAASVRDALGVSRDIREVKMFGGIGFMLNGNLVAAVSPRGLLLRVGKEAEAEALARAGSRPMEMRGRKLNGYVYVDLGHLTENHIEPWLRLARRFVETLPTKEPDAKPARTRGKLT
jgi:TfoX/Sxy family transcriptional regulator of competence genes